MGYKYVKHLSVDGARALAEFWQVLEDHREPVEAAIREVVLSMPAFAALANRVDEQEAAQQRAISRRLERAALCEGHWDPYLDHLTAQGVGYAQMGIELRDWFELLGAYRHVIVRSLLSSGSQRIALALEGMGHFLDIAMATIGSAYVETKESAARQAEHQLGLYIDMFRKASVGMLVYAGVDPDDIGGFRLVAVNPAATRMTGFELANAVGRSIRETSPGMLESEAALHFRSTLATGQSEQWSATWGEPPNERRFQAQTVPLGGGYLGVLFDDVTEQERHLAELERSNRELDEFAYVASHDLKAPLRDIDSLAGWVVEDVGESLPAESGRHLAQLRDRVNRMEGLLEDLLAYSRAGRLAKAPEQFNLRDAVQNAALLAAIPDGFEVEVEGADIELSAPRAPLEQVLRNLLGNAVKHHTRDDGRIRISAAHKGDCVEVSVADDGPGIPHEFHERVFRMFQTLRPRDEIEGSGMGLAIVKKLIEAHAGRLALESAPGEGTTIVFTWPTVSREQPMRED